MSVSGARTDFVNARTDALGTWLQFRPGRLCAVTAKVKTVPAMPLHDARKRRPVIPYPAMAKTQLRKKRFATDADIELLDLYTPREAPQTQIGIDREAPQAPRSIEAEAARYDVEIGLP